MSARLQRSLQESTRFSIFVIYILENVNNIPTLMMNEAYFTHLNPPAINWKC